MLLAILTVVATMASAPSESAVREATRSVLEDSSIQRQLPITEPAQGPAAKKKSSQSERRRERQRSRTRKQRGFGSSLGSAAMYTLMAIVIGLFLFWVARDLLGFEPDPVQAEGGDDTEREIDRGVVERPLGDAESLAKQGQYAEAVHTLLLRTLMELAHRRGQPLQSSLTSREILTRVGLPPNAQSALAEIVDVVEVSYFGNLPIDEGDYRRCLESHRRFSKAFLAGGA